LKSSLKLAISEIENAFTCNKNRSKSWINVAGKYLKYYSSDKYENHYQPDDIVMELIDKILNGRRNWDPDRVPDFDQFIYMNIRSLVEGKFRNRNIVESVPVFEPSAKAGKVYKGLQDDQYEKEPEYEQLIDHNDKLSKCYDILSSDEECGVVFLEMLNGSTSIQIAKYIGTDVAEVEKIKKRIKYKLKKYLS